MANKVTRRQVFDDLHKCGLNMAAIGTDIPVNFSIRETPVGVWLTNQIRVIADDESVAGIAMFSILVRWNLTYRIMFHGLDSHYLACKYSLKMVLEERLLTDYPGQLNTLDSEELAPGPIL